MKAVAYTLFARRQFRKLTPQDQERIKLAVARYAEEGVGDVRALKGRSGFRLRSGSLRVVFTETSEFIEVRAVGDRRDIYR